MIEREGNIPEHVRGAFFDIDGTLTDGGPVWAPLIKAHEVARGRKIWLYGTGFPHYVMSRVGIVNQRGFRERWIVLMAGLMTGWGKENVEEMAETIVQQSLLPHLRRDVAGLVKAYVQAGKPVVLVSTMFQEIVRRFAAAIGATSGLGTQLQFDNGRCSGRIVGKPCAGARKAEFARRFLKEHYPGLDLGSCAVYADSASDVPFLAQGGWPVAVYPDESMCAAAVKNGWPIFAGLRD